MVGATTFGSAFFVAGFVCAPLGATGTGAIEVDATPTGCTDVPTYGETSSGLPFSAYAVRFKVTDTAKTIPVVYTGILPDLFREGKGVVAQGKLGSDGTFKASEVLAKHDENYMPPEAAEALKKAGHTMDKHAFDGQKAVKK